MNRRTRITPAKLVFVYGRVSSEHQRDQVSLPSQFARGEEWAARNAHGVGGRFSDPAISGKRIENRPGVMAALDAVCAAHGVLVCWSFARVARNVEELLMILRRLRSAGADIVSLSQNLDTTTATGRFMLITLANLDELIPNLTGEHVSDVLAYKRERGLKYGEVPYGKRVVRDPACQRETDHEKACSCRLEDDAQERATIRLVEDLRRRMSWPAIAEELNRQSIPTKKGKRWTSLNARKTIGGFLAAETARMEGRMAA